jgi:UPF0755 protein
MQKVDIVPGEGALDIADKLEKQGIIRSASAFYFTALLSGEALDLKPGSYDFSPSMSVRSIIRALVNGPDLERQVLIREGENIYDIDAALADAGIIKKGDLLKFAASSNLPIEGYLFPDTYSFFASSTVSDVVNRFLSNFKEKAEPLLPQDPKKAHDILVIASMLEKEVPLKADQEMVAGIIFKRMSVGMPLQIDATVCYMKEIQKKGEGSCTPLVQLDFAKQSPYNTYIVKGLPPQPIGNPGRDAIEAALHPTVSEYWYYLSDPVSRKTVFATTLDEHNQNRVKYLTK